MINHRAPINVDPQSELAHLLDAAAAAPVVLEHDGVPYRLDRIAMDTLAAGYDPEAIRAATRAAAGAPTPARGEALTAAISRARAEGTRPE